MALLVLQTEHWKLSEDIFVHMLFRRTFSLTDIPYVFCLFTSSIHNTDRTDFRWLLDKVGLVSLNPPSPFSYPCLRISHTWLLLSMLAPETFSFSELMSGYITGQESGAEL